MRTHYLAIVQAQLTSAERAILGAFRDSYVMLELYLASECSSRDPARPHLEEIQALGAISNERVCPGRRRSCGESEH